MDIEHDFQRWSPKSNNSHPLDSLPVSYKPQPPKREEEQLFKEISQILAAGRRRALLILSVAAVVTVAIGYKISQTIPTYTGRFQLLVEPVTTSETKLLSLLSLTLGDSRARIEDFSLDYQSQIRVLRSPKLMYPIIEDLKKRYPEIAYEPLMASLNIERPIKENEGTRILTVSYTEYDPNKVQFVLDKLAKAYLNYSVEERQSYLRQGITFIEEQIPALQERVANLQRQLQVLQEQSNLLNPERTSQTLTEYSVNLQRQGVENRANLDQVRTRYDTLLKLYNEGDFVAVLSQNEVAYSALIRQMHDLDTIIADKASRWNEEHPALQTLREQRQDLQLRAVREAKTILEKAAGEVAEQQARQNVLTQAENRLNQQMGEFPAIARRYSDLQRELEVSTSTLNQLLAKRDALEIDAAQQKVPWDMIAPPELPRTPDGRAIASTVNKKNYVLAAFLGIALGIGVAIIVEILNNVFHSAEQLEEESKIPLLAVIPWSRDLKKAPRESELVGSRLEPMTEMTDVAEAPMNHLLIGGGGGSKPRERRYSSSPSMEAFRTLYTNIRLLRSDRPSHSLVIGSATPGDGKSTVALNLALTAAAIGQRVLLVDADLRAPKIHRKLGLPNLRGLSDVIATDIGLNDVIQQSPLEDNLFVLTSGPVPISPIKLLASPKMQYLIEQFQAFFDLVIYDTPPMVGLADASLLAAKTDGIVLVAKVDKTDRSMLMKALDSLKISGSPVLGIVANGVKGAQVKSYSAYGRI